MQYGNKLAAIDTEEAAYILGFMFADGHLQSGALALQEDDQDVLIKISSWLGTNPPKYIPAQENRLSRKGQYRIFMRREAVNMIHHLGERKELLPDIPDHLLHHFVRGVFDGDGCISIDKRYIDKYPDRAVPADFYILCNRKEHAQQIQSWICTATGNTATEIVVKTGLGNTPIYKIRWGGTSSIIAIRDWLYEDATIYLNRKKNKFDLVRLGDRKTAASNGGKACAEKRKRNHITWKCPTCGQPKTTTPSRVKTYCSKKCSNSRHKGQPLCENPGIKLEP